MEEEREGGESGRVEEEGRERESEGGRARESKG